LDSGPKCLSDAQIRTANRLHAPLQWGYALANGDTDWPGVGASNEGAPGWVNSPAQPRLDSPAAFGPGGALLAALAGDPKFNPLTLDLKAQSALVKHMSHVLDVREDWSALARSKKKTKLIFYSANPDYLVNARGHQRLFDRATEKTGKVVMDRQVRFYVAPNVAHASNGQSATTGQPLPQSVNLLAVLEAWAEDGVVPPDALVQELKAKQAPYRVIRAKPLCRYPTYPHYTGGDPDLASSYACRAVGHSWNHHMDRTLKETG
jgi:feruloyl esterase